MFLSAARTAGAGAVTAAAAAGAETDSSRELPALPEDDESADDEVAASAVSDRFWREEGFSAVADPRVPRARGAGSSLLSLLLVLLEPEPEPVRVARSPRERDGVAFDALEAFEAEELSEDEPDEPFVSAKAIGIATMPEPTPSATARAPMRPMWRA